MSEMKVCKTCKVKKSEDDFYNSGRRKGGGRYKSPDCKACSKAKAGIALAEAKVTRPEPSVSEKKCIVCGELKPGTGFYKRPMASDGLHNICRGCEGAWQANHRKALRESNPKKQKAGVLTRTAKYRAKWANVPFDLTPSDVYALMLDVCPALGIPLNYASDKNSDNSPSLDRFKAALGYVKGNVFVISNLANRIKTSATPEQVQAVADWMKKAEIEVMLS
jgi:hypothetical protein